MEDRHEHEELKRIAPTLFSREPRDPFVVPDGFFERFPHEVQTAIVARSQPQGWAAWPLLLRRAVMAVPVVALLTGAWWLLANKPDQAVAQLSTTPSLEELGWTEEHDLLASLDEADLPALGEPDIEITEAELAAYLDHENVDLTELMIEP